MNKKSINKIVYDIKKIISREIGKRNYERALQAIATACHILYESNLYYSDPDLEDNIKIISSSILSNSSYVAQSNDVVLFYDGFGLNARGLVQIYLRALCKIKKIIYVTRKSAKDEIPDLLDIIDGHGVVAYVDGNSILEKIESLNKIVTLYNPKHFFFYSLPWDVIGVCALSSNLSKAIRYQIDLTDHAFWLGSKVIDICIEFRSYGAFIAKKYRKISEDKIMCIPYYPIINDIPFEGYPSSGLENRKIVFSGGALYKTLGNGNKYYEIVRHILSTYPDTIFWYAGSGDSSEMDKVLAEYPSRAFLTKERKDLVEVIKHSCIYLSTYPVCGGLMFQYAAAANRVPVTLKDSDITNDFLINQADLGIEFESISDLYDEIDKLLTDNDYRREKEKLVSNSLIEPETFNALVKSLIEGQYCSLFPVVFTEIDINPFLQIYWERMNNKKINAFIATKDNGFFIRYMPIRFIKGCFMKMFKK